MKYEVIFSKLFDKNYDLLKPAHKVKLDKAIKMLRQGTPLPENYQDHNLKGKMSHLREFHLSGNLIVTYYLEDNILRFVDVGSHDILRSKSDLEISPDLFNFF